MSQPTAQELMALEIFEFEGAVAEIQAENLSETALFGDSGPGSALRLSEMKAALGRLKATYARLYPRPEPPVPGVAPAPANDDDLPF